MLQVRKLVLAVAAATSMASGMAHALGLGEISVKSALNEPLVAEIELLDTKGLSPDEIRSKLASAEDFSRAGVDRQFFLNNLRFTPVIRQNGKSIVRVTSSQAVREPYLNFLLEVYWPAGRLLKEYTLLLDPPMYTPQELVYRDAPTTTPATAPAAGRAPEQSTSVRIPPRSTAPAAAAQQTLQGDQYRVQTNDTLWEIALRVNRSGGFVHQTMLAIQDLNPDAFIDGNINRLKSGQVLKLPNAEQIRQRSRTDAVAEFQSQVDAWRGGVVERQLDARRRDTAAAAPARVEQGDSLRLVAGETGKTEAGSDSGSTDSALADQLALAKEQLDSSRLQNEDLASRVEELSSQVEKLQRLLELKNTQLANLQNLMDEEQAALVTAAEELETTAADVKDAPGEAVPEQEVVVPDPSREGPVAADGSADEEAEEKKTGPAELAEAATETAAPAAVESKPAEQQADSKPKPKPVVFDPPPASKSFVEELMENPMLLPAAGGGVGLLLLLLLLRRRQQAKQEVLPPEEEGLFAQDPVMAMPDGDESMEADLDVLDGVLDDPKAGMEEPAEFTDQPAAQAAETPDPIDEAESFIAFGRFSQAADVLLKAIDADPQRENLRFKLLEVYADLEDRNAFLQQVEELEAMGADQAGMNAMRQRFPHMLGEDDGGLSLDDIMLDMPGTGVTGTAQESDVDVLAEDIPDLDGLLNDPEPGSKTLETEPSAEDEFASLLESVENELEGESGLDSFELPEIEDLTLEDFELPEADSLEGAREDSLNLDEGFALEDFQFDDQAPAAADTEAAGFGQDLDLSLPLDETQTSDFIDDLDVGTLESELESLENSFNALQGDIQETLQEPAEPPPVQTEQGDELDELDELFGLDAGLDLSTPEVEQAQESASEVEDDVLAALEQELDDDFAFLQGDDEDKTKLDLASAWIDMGDIEGAREILDEVLRDGAPEHQELAKELMTRLG